MSKRLIMHLALVTMLGYCQQVHSSGFALIEQSVSSMGIGYAGGAAIADDASTVFFNPAGMTRICNFESLSGSHFIIPVAKFDDDGSTHLLGGSLKGSNGHDAGELALVSHSYYVKSFQNCGLSFGLGLNAPFGLVTDYGHNWKGRYHAIRSAVLSININPSVAYRINDCWSIGAGVSAMYLHAKLTNAVDFGTILFLNLIEGTPQEEDGKVILKGNSWGFGGNVGILYEYSCRTRFGALFRSEVTHHIKGSEKFDDVPEELAEAFQDTRLKADATLPSTLSFSGYHEFNDCWAIMGDITWTKWKVLKRLRFRFNNPLQPDSQITTKWENTFRYALGTSYRPYCYPCWIFRTGVAYDETPIKNKELRTPRVPGEDRLWTTFGVGYQWRCFQFDFGYAHLFVRTPKIDKTKRGPEISTGLFDFELPEDRFRGGLKGDYDARTDIISAQFIWWF